MAATKTLHPVEKLEGQYWEAIKKGDAGLMRQMTGDEFSMVMGGGLFEFDRDSFVKMMIEDFDLKAYDMSGTKVREIAPGVVAVMYDAHSEYVKEGKKGSMDTRNLSIWAKEGDDWRCVLGAEGKQE